MGTLGPQQAEGDAVESGAVARILPGPSGREGEVWANLSWLVDNGVISARARIAVFKLSCPGSAAPGSLGGSRLKKDGSHPRRPGEKVEQRDDRPSLRLCACPRPDAIK